GARTGSVVGFDTAVLVDAVDRQVGIEALAGPGTPILTVTEPTETATAAAFAHTAVLAGRPGNAEPLAEAGRLFGRLAHLLDAVEDRETDTASGAWNPITATGTSLEEARRLADDALHGIRLALREVEFEDGRLAHVLLAHELRRSVDRAFGTESCGHAPEGAFGPPPQLDEPPTPHKRGFLTGCAVAVGLCCTCQVCCADEFEGPWSRKKREGWCNDCDCDCGDCGDCGDCCDCCNCCGNCCSGCDGCDCDCGCN
ncbi:hypothetical protein ABT173_26855, partial [Streptomyces sp. NPDC001795]